jgi:hypothetical protein
MNEVNLIQKQIDQIDNLKAQERWSSDYKAWERKTASLLEKIFGVNSRQSKDFEKINYSVSVFTSSTPDSVFDDAFKGGLDDAKAILQSMAEELIEFNIKDDSEINNEISDNPYLFIIGLLEKFHLIARQLRSRHNQRQTLEVNDEYDVQDLLHALLKVKFDDIRREEWTPNYAGGSARMDIFIKDLGIVIEVKKTRPSLRDKKIGEELIIDIAKYRKHPECNKLICFVYDPEGLIGNPAGLASDLSSDEDDFTVEAVIRP